MSYILAIDQGTTSSRAILFDKEFNPVSTSQKEFDQHYPKSGWVEHNPKDIWETTIATCRNALEGRDISKILGVGITNQRETTLVWDRNTGQPVYNAIVWQDRRTSDYCSSLKERGLEPEITEKTGLLLDPYFSATKIRWILQNVEGAMEKAKAGELLFGTVDTFLIWKLTGGSKHVTDITNASRTLLFNLAEEKWDQDLLDLFEIPRSMLPEVRECASEFGTTEEQHFGVELPIRGVAGDQQAATIGQACFSPGMLKATYGTGCFALLNTGDTLVPSKNRLLTTIAYKIDGKTHYALEGSIFIAGAVVQWLRDGLQIISDAGETQALASEADPQQDIILVPAFTGLGAPYWDSECRGALFGITRNTGPKELSKAALSSVAFQTVDLWEAMNMDYPGLKNVGLRADGGMTESNYTMQKVADFLNTTVEVPKVPETTALGAAYLAGYQSGLFTSLDEIGEKWARAKSFQPKMDTTERDRNLASWKKAVARTLTNPA
ncbi:MAG: glycerol kinase GlpK [Paracoccaceae bacterium]|nr:glycerol kinase GlpK [Paracoccaceae bacterium]MYJ87661.1 glycerol kinase GlpK [Paracoccaceae bacterium]